MPDDQHHIASVAHALCLLDGIDTSVPRPTGEVFPLNAPGIGTIKRVMVEPAWKAREAEAARFVAAARAMGLLK